MLTSVEQQHLEQLMKGLQEDLRNRNAFKWGLMTILLERYAADLTRDPSSSSWPKDISSSLRDPRMGIEMRLPDDNYPCASVTTTPGRLG